MIKLLKQYKPFVLLSIIIVIGALLRFYKLDWAQGLFTHPDEYHIVASVNQLSFPTQMHPHFFSYGTVTIYLIYFTQEFLKYLSTTFNFQLSTFNSFLLGRFYSALFSTLTILIVYKICKSFLEKHFSLLAAFMCAITPGLIQQAHFATPESALTFFLFGSLLFMIKFLKAHKNFYLILASVFLGFALGVKISSIVFLLPLAITIVLSFRAKRSGAEESHLPPIVEEDPSMRSFHSLGRDDINNSPFKYAFKVLLKFIGLILISLIVTISTFALAAPYVFLDYPAFMSNLNYEGSLAIGKIPVFYTRQFIDTIPVLFQIEKILPYALGPALLIFGVLGLVYFCIKVIKTIASRKINNETMKQSNNLVLITIAFLSLFLPNAFLFAKWTRFIAPTFPFFAIFVAFFLQRFEKSRIIFYSLSVILLVGTTLWTTAFFSIYTTRDIRITASEWLETYAKPGSTFLVEGGNMIDLPLRGNFPRTSLDFYALENDSLTRERIIDALDSSDYFLVQSRRVFMNHQRLSNMFPKTANLYDNLFNGDLGFKQIKTFHSYPKLEIGNWKLEIPDEGAEETWSVFDHPVIRIFKKNAQLTREGYARFLEL